MNEKKAFVLMPFAEDLNEVYSYLIQESLISAGFEVRRADDIKSLRNILSDIIEGITSSDLIIADLTGANPNVYYELGIAHALNKKVILLTQEIQELPFDLRSYRVIPYGIHFSQMKIAKDSLIDLAKQAYLDNIPFGNPVNDFTASNTKEINVAKEQQLEKVENDELGFIDYFLLFENGFTEMIQIISSVGDKLQKELTPLIDETTRKLNIKHVATEQRRKDILKLAESVNDYGSFLKPNNEKYRNLLKDVESSLDYVFNERYVVNSESTHEINVVIEQLTVAEESAFKGRQSFAHLVLSMENLPKIEKNFDKANAFMATQVKEFISNVDQTTSILSRAKRLCKMILDNQTKIKLQPI